MRVFSSQRWGGLVATFMVATVGLWSCASEEIPKYGDPAQVAGGVGGGTTSPTTGGSEECVVDQNCDVKFKTQIFPWLDTVAKCADSGCHADGKGNLLLVAGDSDSYYDALTAYELDNAPDVGPYVVPCAPDASKMLCNLKVSDGDNPHGSCGATMPILAKNGPTLADLSALEDWIACGAPNN
ncbi:MAG: hypothetical protein IPK82_14495 [Polyangiaceae bacterium]|nr:hypothetical protein [Polyangiaceae bacterium]